MRISSLVTLTAMALTVSVLNACEPTPRTALNDKKQDQQEASTTANATAEATATAEAPAAADKAVEANATKSVVQIKAVADSYNILTPWNKTPSATSRTLGVYLGDGLVLTTSDVGSNSTYIELGIENQTDRVTAVVVKTDPDRDLTLIKLKNPAEGEKFFASRTPLSLGEPLKIGDKAEVWFTIRGTQVQKVGLTVESSDEGAYFSPLLEARVEQSIDNQSINGIPVVKDGKIVSLGIRYDNDTQMLTMINAEVIENFLNQNDKSKLRSPDIAINYQLIDNPTLLRYLKLDEKTPGFFVGDITKHSPAEQAGIKKGDVIYEIDGQKVDSNGLVELPLYGPINAFTLLQGVKQIGETTKVTVGRDGKIIKDIAITMNRDSDDKALVKELAPGQKPRYIMEGGILMQPLTRDFMNAIYGRARGGMPAELLEIDNREEELLEKGYEELSVISIAIPTPATLGYESVRYCLIEKVNGKPVLNFSQLEKLLDEPTPDGITSITINKAPYTIYLDKKLVQSSNDMIRRSDIPVLRYMGEKK